MIEIEGEGAGRGINHYSGESALGAISFFGQTFYQIVKMPLPTYIKVPSFILKIVTTKNTKVERSKQKGQSTVLEYVKVS